MNQVVFDTSEICYQYGVRQAVFSPGSRNAPLSISFHRNNKINTRVILDERSAGFIALGIAQQTGKPVVLCCTSGTALLNYGPAIAEAYYQQIPLIVLSADRPPEWIDQWDGQTIRQQGALANHIKGFEQLPVDTSGSEADDYRRKLIALILLSQSGQPGPVHCNIPFREPFYPALGHNLQFSKIEAAGSSKKGSDHEVFSDSLIASIKGYRRKIIVLGQGHPNDATKELLYHLSNVLHIPVINEITGNGHEIEGVIEHQDAFLYVKDLWKDLQPDLVLTIGLSTISKNMKLMLRESSCDHWHIDPVTDRPGNTFQKLTSVIKSFPFDFLKHLTAEHANDPGFQLQWQKAERRAENVLEKLGTMPYAEYPIFSEVLDALPNGSIVHLANSMPVRYANFLGINKKDLTVYCNRGTSGIDGTNSTAVGHALSSERLNILMTGDLSFLYDRNAFLHEYDLSNLRVIVFNNYGGGIFDLIPGPVSLPLNEKESHFTTPHHKDMKLSAADAGMHYIKVNDEITLQLTLDGFFDRSDQPKLLEIQTDPKTNQEVYKKIKNSIQ
ncbi:MAG: 2-succinyl-5-enolpyruvyl-6-hydroxy-3-cyclohexene-1-carboxylate synthase [Cyclobacteriaceae bacterium]|jgi:2-succinyl-5-enolpyruvyl-6-hydroxy-3-cyclohexene-1-carboxylate synthase